MKLTPRNRHVLVEVIEQARKEEKETSILLPEDYRPQKEPIHNCASKRQISRLLD